MLDTMRSWASRYCPDLGGTETPIDTGGGDGEGESEGTARWVLVDTSVNPNGEPTEFAGGGATEGWYTEARFEGKTLSITAAETSITLADRDVDHGFENYNITLTTSFAQPPSEMVPGDTITLTVTASHSGTVTVGNPGLQFWYSSNDVGISPDTVLAYYPWAPEFEGTSTKTYSFVVPDTYDGGQLELSASWWNCPACVVIWRYEVEQDEKTSPTQEPPSYI